MVMRYLVCTFVLLVGCGEVVKGNPDAPVDADPCTGTCECRVDDDCPGAHTACDDQITSRTCGCAAGYAPNLADACEWVGVVTDPGFGAASAWMVGGMAAIDVNLNEAGMIDPGAARYHEQGLCQLSRITQTLQMPRLSRAEPLVATITYRFLGTFGNQTPPAFAIGPSWHADLPTAATTFKTARACLGAGQYAPESTVGKGADVPLQLMPATLISGFMAQCDDPAFYLDLDRFDIVPADPGECPTPGTAVNGDAEGMGGWTFSGSSANGNPFTMMIEPAVGEANTRGVRLFARNRCSNLSAVNHLSIPTADVVSSPALSFYNKTTASLSGVETTPILAGVALPGIAATGTGLTWKACVPAFMRGGVFAFSAQLDLSGTCADVVNAESVVDNLKVINDPSCGTDETITDPGFESSLQLIGGNDTPGKSLVRILSDPGQAHAGNGALQMSVMQLCSGASWQANVVVPPILGSDGPALTFFYKATPMANYRFTATAATDLTFAPTLDNQYHQGKVCLDPKLATRNQTVTFSMSGGGGTCATTHPPEIGYVDDLVVTTDPSCPIQ